MASALFSRGLEEDIEYPRHRISDAFVFVLESRCYRGQMLPQSRDVLMHRGVDRTAHTFGSRFRHGGIGAELIADVLHPVITLSSGEACGKGPRQG